MHEQQRILSNTITSNKFDDLTQSIEAYVKKHRLITHGSRIILGLSGGPDSVFLLYFLAARHHAGEITLVAAHLDHEWRHESSQDVLLCQKIANQLNIQLIVKKASQITPTQKYNGSREAHARHMRHLFFEQIASEVNADRIALAHHAQDQQETFFIRLIRGSSLQGLVGMQPHIGLYIRPLLETNKDDIVAYLDHHEIAYAYDTTNNDDTFLRNRIRKYVIPALKQSDARFEENFAHTIKRLCKAEASLDNMARNIFSQIDTVMGLDITSFLTLADDMQYRVLLHWLCKYQVDFTPTQSLFNEIIRFFGNTLPKQSKSHAIFQQWHIIAKDGYAHFQHQTD